MASALGGSAHDQFCRCLRRLGSRHELRPDPVQSFILSL